jgi:hypothetical protein
MLRKLLSSSAVVMALLLSSGWQVTTQTPPPAQQDQEMADDLQKMQAILNQMRTNLAFVGSSTTPLNHQFQLEIDMWQTLLNQMNERMRRSGTAQH